jgi:hypothetical protein
MIEGWGPSWPSGLMGFSGSFSSGRVNDGALVVSSNRTSGRCSSASELKDSSSRLPAELPWHGRTTRFGGGARLARRVSPGRYPRGGIWHGAGGGGAVSEAKGGRAAAVQD